MRKFRKPLRIKKRKTIFNSRFFWFLILILVIANLFFYFLFFSNYFQVKKIIITGQKKVSIEDFKSLIEKNLEKKIWFFKTKSIFLVNLNEIRKEILKNFPQVAEIKLQRDFPDVLRVIIEERLALAQWCQEKCFLIDKEGIIFEEIFEESNQYLKIRSQNQIFNLNFGKKILEPELLTSILEIASKLKENFKIPLEEISVVSEKRFNAKTSEGWQIYFNSKEDLDWQLTKLKAVLEKEIPLQKRKDLEYIDVRFGNFAPYKYHD